MEITLTLTEAQEYGLNLYAASNGYKTENNENDIPLAASKMIEASAKTLIAEEYKDQQRSITTSEMLAELSSQE